MPFDKVLLFDAVLHKIEKNYLSGSLSLNFKESQAKDIK